jgi:hypothetical protein
MSDPVITRRNEPTATRQKRTTCQLTEDGKSLKYSGFRLVLVARGQKTHRVGVPVGQEEAFFRAALKEYGWSDEEIATAAMAAVGNTIKDSLFDRRDTPYGANMAFDFRVDAGQVCNEQTVAGNGNGSISQMPASNVSSALDMLKKKVDEVRARTSAAASMTTPTTAKAKK